MTEERFWQRVNRSDDPDSCWPWTGSKHADGYGKLRWHGGNVLSHRKAYELANGDIPEGLCVRHKCDNRPCCNPAHLEVGTWADNVNDKVSRGRHRRGENAGTAKLTAANVEEIRRSFRNGTSRYDLAYRFDVSHTQICNIINGKRWRESIAIDPDPMPSEEWRALLRKRINARSRKR